MRSVIAIVAASLVATSALAADDPWPGLTPTEQQNLTMVLKQNDPASIVIACASKRCAEIAKDITTVFVAAAWEVATISHGGLGIDGVSGLRVTGCGIGPEKLRDAVAEITRRPVEVVTEKDCGGDPSIFFVIGEKQ